MASTADALRALLAAGDVDGVRQLLAPTNAPGSGGGARAAAAEAAERGRNLLHAGRPLLRLAPRPPSRRARARVTVPVRVLTVPPALKP